MGYAREGERVARTWLSIRIELVCGRGEDYWPRPGRIFAAAQMHTFAQLAAATDSAFARWDLAHLHAFTLLDGTHITAADHWDGDAPAGSLDSRKIKLSRLQPGEQFAYVFDFGDDWTHLCTVDHQRIDPLDELGIAPATPRPLLRLGRPARPVRPALGRRRWRHAAAETTHQPAGGPTTHHALVGPRQHGQ